MNGTQAGTFDKLKVLRVTSIGVYLDGGETGDILLPNRFVPEGAKEDDFLDVFIYHDSEDRLIATTQQPIGVVGDIVSLKCVSNTKQGAFMDWGLMKDLFVPVSQQSERMFPGQPYLVMIYRDEKTGRIAGTQKFTQLLTNDMLDLKEHDVISFLVWQKTPLGYKVIINNKNLGLIHFSDAPRDLEIGEREKGFIKKVYDDDRVDVVMGERGYQRVGGAADAVMQALEENNGYLPYSDSSSPDEIREVFGMSKKTFKMVIGKLYKEGVIELTKTGIRRSV